MYYFLIIKQSIIYHVNTIFVQIKILNFEKWVINLISVISVWRRNNSCTLGCVLMSSSIFFSFLSFLFFANLAIYNKPFMANFSHISLILYDNFSFFQKRSSIFRIKNSPSYVFIHFSKFFISLRFCNLYL